MSSPISSPPSQTHTDEARDLAAHRRRVVDELIDIGAELARLVLQQAKAHAAAEGAPGGVAGFEVAFERVSRAVRRTVLLAERLAVPVAAGGGAGAAGGGRVGARKRIIREVEDFIHRHTEDDEARRRGLEAEFRDRLDAPELEEEIADRPVADIVADICNDFGLAGYCAGAHGWKRRTQADVAALCARAAAAAGELGQVGVGAVGGWGGGCGPDHPPVVLPDAGDGDEAVMAARIALMERLLRGQDSS